MIWSCGAAQSPGYFTRFAPQKGEAGPTRCGSRAGSQTIQHHRDAERIFSEIAEPAATLNDLMCGSGMALMTYTPAYNRHSRTTRI